MGVGVYSSSFQGTGGTFLVDLPIFTEEQYKDYVKDSLSGDVPKDLLEETLQLFLDGEIDNDDLSEMYDSISYIYDEDDWRQQEYDDFNTLLIEEVEGVARELGFRIESRKGFSADRADFDSEFVAIADNGFVQIGWRSWEHDFVIGVGAHRNTLDMASEPEGNATDIIENYGLSPEAFAKAYAMIADSVEEYVRIRLLEKNFECRYKTSGYTTDGYTLGDKDEVAARKEALMQAIEDGYSFLKASPTDNILDADHDEIVALAKAMLDANDNWTDRFAVQVPVWDKAQGGVLLFKPGHENATAIILPMRTGEDGTKEVNHALIGYLNSLPDEDGLAALPRNEMTAEFLRQQQAKYNKSGVYDLIVTAEEWVEAKGEDCVLTWSDEDPESATELVLARYDKPALAPLATPFKP